MFDQLLPDQISFDRLLLYKRTCQNLFGQALQGFHIRRICPAWNRGLSSIMVVDNFIIPMYEKSKTENSVYPVSDGLANMKFLTCG